MALGLPSVVPAALLTIRLLCRAGERQVEHASNWAALIIQV
jgi:hypothetical protein